MLLNKVDVRPIILGHIATLRDNRFAGKVSKGDIAVFFVIPSLTGVVVIGLGFHFRIDAVNGFLNAFSVLTGLLLNLLVLVFALATTNAPSDTDATKRKTLIREIFANVCFAALNSIVVVCTALVSLSYMRSNPGATTGYGATFLLSTLTLNFVLTLLMVMKRMYILLNKEVGNDSAKPHKAA